MFVIRSVYLFWSNHRTMAMKLEIMFPSQKIQTAADSISYLQFQRIVLPQNETNAMRFYAAV